MGSSDVDMVMTDVGMALTSKKRIKFEVELYGDIVCPWSYLGKKSLDSAIQSYSTKHPDDVFDIIWKPFLLWPAAEVSAYDKRAPMVKMVGPARAAGVFARLFSLAAEYGIHFNWDGLVGNSADAHKLVMLAYEIDQKLRKEQAEQPGQQQFQQRNQHSAPPTPPDSGLSDAEAPSSQTRSILNQTQHAFLEALFYTTLTQGFDPSDRSFLISLALSMDPPLANYPSELVAYLEGEESTRKLGLGLDRSSSHIKTLAAEPRVEHHPVEHHPVEQQKQQHQNQNSSNKKDDDKESANNVNPPKDSSSSKGSPPPPPPQHVINAVPSVIVQGRYRVGGMQKPEVYLRVFEKVREGYLASSS
ncbi:DSBA-like thioredoxin domain containing protein [Rhypophila decipiens]